MLVSGFSFIDDLGKLEYKVDYKYSATHECCPSLAYYSHDSYEFVSSNNDMDCQTKLSHAQGFVKFQNSSARDNSDNSGNYSTQCFKINDDTNLRQCSGVLRVHSLDRWWFFVLSHCNSSKGLDISYEFTFTNGDSWEKHLSGEEIHILEGQTVSLGSILLLFAAGLYCTRRLLQLDKFHRAFKLFMSSLSCEVTAQILECIYYTQYVRSGVELPPLQTIAELLHCTSEVIFVVLLILLANGWTMTRACFGQKAQKNLTIFCSLYILNYGILFVYKQGFSDPESSHLLFEGLVDKGYRILRIIAWVCFAFGIYFSIRNNPEKKKFYLQFGAYCSVWFLFAPLSIPAFSFLSEPNQLRVMRLFRFPLLVLLGFSGVLYLMRPSKVDVNFPFRVRGNEVDTEQVQDLNNFQRAEYVTFTELGKAEDSAF